MVGQYCEGLLDHHVFRHLCREFESICAQRVLNTSATQSEAREEAYHTFRGAREFLDYMNSFITQKNDILRGGEENRLVAVEAGVDPNMLPDEDVLLGDNLHL